MSTSQEIRNWKSPAYRYDMTDMANSVVKLEDRIAELETENKRLEAEIEEFIRVFDEEKVVDCIGVFNRGDDPEEALGKIIQWNMEIARYFSKEKIKELEQEIAAELREKHGG